MKIEYKAVGVTGLKVDSDDEGVVTALVSVTGLTDNVKDIIKPGAYAKSLAVRTPKGVWHHNWHESVSRTEAIKELLPGSPELPKTLPDNSPWPADAGALQVKTRFNLKTTRGREAYEDVMFFGDQQEWSIGYNVPVGGATMDSKSGVRTINTLDLYEYSPVLWGAMPSARTTSVKDAQEGFAEVKRLHGDEAHQFLMEVKSMVGDEDIEMAPDDDVEYDDDVEDLFPDLDASEEKSAFMSAAQKQDIESAIKALQSLLDVGDDDREAPENEEHEEKSLWKQEYKTLADLVQAADLDASLDAKAAAFDTAHDASDIEAMEVSATPILDAVSEGVSGEKADALRAIAEYIVEAFTEAGEGADDTPQEKSDGSGFPQDYDLEYQFKRNFSPANREVAAGKGHAMPDGSFPIENEEDLKNAVQAWGRAKDRNAAKTHIMKRAKDMGAMHMLPDTWDMKSDPQKVEMKSLDYAALMAALDD